MSPVGGFIRYGIRSRRHHPIHTLAETDAIEELTGLLHRSYKIPADMSPKYLAIY